MDSAYARSTAALAQGYRQYAALDLYDPERIQVGAAQGLRPGHPRIRTSLPNKKKSV